MPQIMGKLAFICLSIILNGCSDRVKPTQSVARLCELPTYQTRQAIVRIRSGDNTSASGVVIAPNTILTAAHILEPSRALYVMIGNNLHAATLQLSDINLDLALISADTGNLKPIAINPTPIHYNEPLWAVGFPLSLSQKISVGYYQKTLNGRVYSSNHVNSGVSGGGLLRCNQGQFELAGIIHGYVALLQNHTTVNIGDSTAVPSSVILSFLSTYENPVLSSASGICDLNLC